MMKYRYRNIEKRPIVLLAIPDTFPMIPVWLTLAQLPQLLRKTKERKNKKSASIIKGRL